MPPGPGAAIVVRKFHPYSMIVNMPPIQIPDPKDQPPFRPIHFAANASGGDVRIFVWHNLNEALSTLKRLVPNLRPFLTAEHIRGLAAPEWDDFHATLVSLDEFAALWFAKTVYDPGIVFPDQLEDLYAADGAARHAKRLMDFAAGKQEPSEPFSCCSQWKLFVQKLVLIPTLEKYCPKHPIARQELMIDAKPCKNCDIPPVGLVFPHATPNWMIYCPSCDMGTDPREGWSRAAVLEIWNKSN